MIENSELLALAGELTKVLVVMKSAHSKNQSMAVWDDDIGAVERASVALRSLASGGASEGQIAALTDAMAQLSSLPSGESGRPVTAPMAEEEQVAWRYEADK